VNLFIADDVGLGKTIEAGLIVRELLMRQKVRRVVICAPPSVVVQWREEMESRFGLGFVVLDRDNVASCRRERGFGVNPWNTHTRFNLSHALLRDETYAGPLRDWLGEWAGGSLLILDEAHNAAPASGAKYAGQWVNNRYEGHGKYLFVDGSTYEGTCHENQMHGAGVFFDTKGISWEGQFYNGTGPGLNALVV
jgi:hypothetical protein